MNRMSEGSCFPQLQTLPDPRCPGVSSFLPPSRRVRNVTTDSEKRQVIRVQPQPCPWVPAGLCLRFLSSHVGHSHCPAYSDSCPRGQTRSLSGSQTCKVGRDNLEGVQENADPRPFPQRLDVTDPSLDLCAWDTLLRTLEPLAVLPGTPHPAFMV